MTGRHYTCTEIHDGFYMFSAETGYHFNGGFGKNLGTVIYDICPELSRNTIIIKDNK